MSYNSNLLVDRISHLCEEHAITFCQLEQKLSIGNGMIAKWRTNRPRAETVLEVAEYFHVSVDWLLGLSDDRAVQEDQEMLSIRRARDKMTQQQKDEMMTMLKIGFKDAFKE